MKKNYVLLGALLFSALSFGQAIIFNNASGAGDSRWSTATNWAGGALPTAAATINANVNLDIPVTLSTSIQGATTTVSGASKLTITTTSTSGVGILSTGTNFTYDAAVEFTGPATNVRALQVNNASGASYKQLTLGPNSVLTANCNARTVPQFDSKVVCQGKIDGAGGLQFGPGICEFASTSDNSGFNGDMVFFSPGATVISSNTVAGSFLKAGRKVQVNNANGVLTLNGANTCNGNLSVATTNSFTFNVNANQESFGNLTVGSGTITINVNPAVTNLSFANTAANVWGTGNIVFTGYQSGEIRFGTDNTALTAGQMAKITADGAATGQALGLDANGYLVLASTLSNESFTAENQIRISYPTRVENQIYFSKSQQNVEIFDFSGRTIRKVSDKNGINELNTADLTSGMYLIVFDGAKTEKFIKN